MAAKRSELQQRVDEKRRELADVGAEQAALAAAAAQRRGTRARRNGRRLHVSYLSEDRSCRPFRRKQQKRAVPMTPTSIDVDTCVDYDDIEAELKAFEDGRAARGLNLERPIRALGGRQPAGVHARAQRAQHARSCSAD